MGKAEYGKSKAPVTAPGKDYNPIVDMRKQFREERRKTIKLFRSNQVTGDEAVKYLNAFYRERLGKGYKFDSGLMYYRDLIKRMTHCHTRSHWNESIAKILSEFRNKFGTKPSGAASKLLGLLEGALLNKLQHYYKQYHKDVELENKLRKKESDFLEKHGDDYQLPGWRVPARPEPFELIPEDGDMPDMPRPSPGLPGSESSNAHPCGAKCRTKEDPCERHTNKRYCYQHNKDHKPVSTG